MKRFGPVACCATPRNGGSLFREREVSGVVIRASWGGRVLVLGVCFLGVLLTAMVGCGKTGEQLGPEVIIQVVLDACREARHAEVIRYFSVGDVRALSVPGPMVAFLDRISDNGNAVTFEVRDRKEQGSILQLQITTYSDQELKEPLRTSVWSFEKVGRGWVITGVR